MPDAPSRPRASPPVGWGDAFAALPMEAPSAPGWPRVAAALDARERGRRPLWLATAAALALVALVPLQRLGQEERVDARPVATSIASSQGSNPALTDARPVPPAPSGNPRSRAGGKPTAGARVASATATSPPMDAPAATAAVLPRVRDDDSRQPARIATASTARGRALAPGRPPRTRPRADAATTPGAVVAGRSAAPVRTIETAVAGTAAGSTTPELDRLHAESAQLEALVALARDDRMSTGTVAALGGELQARVARIDAALAEPSPAPEQRLDLWRERVDALRELAGFETTQRLLAARGEQYDGMLVSVD